MNTKLLSKLGIQLPSPVTVINPSWPNAEHYSLSIKRDDQIHPIISGNKWRKLAPMIQTLSDDKVHHVISFGGGYSNHIHALAYCCHQLGMRCTALIRGDYSQNETPMLLDAKQWGCEIQYLTKREYSQRNDGFFLRKLKNLYPQSRLIKEGGSERDSLSGMQGLVDEIGGRVDYLLCPVASGGTIAGLAQAKGQIKQLIGIAVLKGEDYLQSLVAQLIDKHPITTPYEINHNYHFGGYAKISPELQSFCDQQSKDLGITVEPIYSGKTLYALSQLVSANAFPHGSRIMMLHTGGLQGAR